MEKFKNTKKNIKILEKEQNSEHSFEQIHEFDGKEIWRDY
jgi:hypothetical protein